MNIHPLIFCANSFTRCNLSANWAKTVLALSSIVSRRSFKYTNGSFIRSMRSLTAVRISSNEQTSVMDKTPMFRLIFHTGPESVKKEM